jgi:hypothetical protein
MKLVRESEQLRVQQNRIEKEKLEVFMDMNRGEGIEESNRRCVLAHEEAARQSALAEYEASVNYEAAERLLESSYRELARVLSAYRASIRQAKRLRHAIHDSIMEPEDE